MLSRYKNKHMPLEINSTLLGLATALGVGLLIGLERERRKAEQKSGVAGLRTFALTALLGALGTLFDEQLVLVVLTLVVGLLALAAHQRATEEDPGLTTEIALVVTFVLGALAMREVMLAAGIGVLVAVMLAARTRLHNFARKVITDEEMRDALLLAAAALVILPLTPNHVVGPYEVLNPRKLWTLAVLMMAINAAGYVALRAAGPRFGLSFAGFASGFVSSSATIAAMASRARRNPELRRGAVSGAVLSSVATVLQLGVILGATSTAALQAVALPLAGAGLVAIAYGAIYAWHTAKQSSDQPIAPGRAFDPRVALLFAGMIGAVLLLSAAVTDWLGTTGLWLASALSGFADAHAPAAAVGAMTAGGKLNAAQAVVPILAAFTTNSVTKVVIALSTGDTGFAWQVIPGVVLMVAAAWLGAGLQSLF